MSKYPLTTNHFAYIRAERNILSFYCVGREIYESAEYVRSFDKSLLPIYAGVHVSIHFAYTYARLGDFRMHFPLFSSSSLFHRRVARTQHSLSSSLPFSLFVRASHGSIIRYVSNFRLSEFFARSFRIIPAVLRKKISRVSVPSAIFPLKPIFIYYEKCRNFVLRSYSFANVP